LYDNYKDFDVKAHIGAGKHFGEYSIKYKTPIIITAVAKTFVSVITLEKNEYNKFILEK